MALTVSQLLDGQLDPGLTKKVLDEVVADDHARDRLTIYGLIGDALRGNPTPMTDSPSESSNASIANRSGSSPVTIRSRTVDLVGGACENPVPFRDFRPANCCGLRHGSGG